MEAREFYDFWQLVDAESERSVRRLLSTSLGRRIQRRLGIRAAVPGFLQGQRELVELMAEAFSHDMARYSGQPFLVHPFRVAYLSESLLQGTMTRGLVHDLFDDDLGRRDAGHWERRLKEKGYVEEARSAWLQASPPADYYPMHHGYASDFAARLFQVSVHGDAGEHAVLLADRLDNCWDNLFAYQESQRSLQGCPRELQENVWRTLDERVASRCARLRYTAEHLGTVQHYLPLVHGAIDIVREENLRIHQQRNHGNSLFDEAFEHAMERHEQWQRQFGSTGAGASKQYLSEVLADIV